MPFVCGECDPQQIPFFHHDRAFRRYNPPQTATQSVYPGLANRRYFVERLHDLLASAAARDSPLAAVVFDVDHFKRINDNNGHGVGDLVLITTAHTCLALLDDGEFAARIGGEEFAILLPDTDLISAEQFADRLRGEIAAQHLAHDCPDGATAITVSVGVTVARPGDSLDTFLSRADDALYDAKRGGRNMVAVRHR